VLSSGSLAGTLVDQRVLFTFGIQVDHAGFTRFAALRQGLADDLGNVQVHAVVVVLGRFGMCQGGCAAESEQAGDTFHDGLDAGKRAVSAARGTPVRSAAGAR